MNARDIATIKLVNAAIAGDVPDMRLALTEGAYLNDAPAGFTSNALYYAVENGRLEAVDYLLRATASTEIAYLSASKETPLFAAVRNGSKDIVQLLCKFGARVNITRHDTATPLIISAMHGSDSCMQVLLKNGADAKYFNKYNFSALTYAATSSNSGRVYTLTVLIDHLIATHQHNPQGLLTFLQTHDELKDRFVKIISAEAGIQLFRLIRFLLDKNISRDEVNKLMPEKFRYIYDKLQAKRYDAEQTKKLRDAAGEGNIPEVIKALENDADINGIARGRKMTPVTGAADCKRIDVVRLLLERGANPEARSTQNATTLHVAVQNGDVDIVKLLLANKVNVNAQTNDGATAIYMAAYDGHDEIVKLLLSNAADAMILKKDMSPLIAAILQEHGRCAELIVDNMIARYRSNPRELLNYLTNDDHLKYCFQYAKDSASFSAVLKLFLFVAGKEFDNDLLSKLLPSFHDLNNKLARKSDILKVLKTLPIKTRIAYCEAILGFQSDLQTKYWIFADHDRHTIRDILNSATAELVAAKLADESVLVRKLYDAAAIGDTELAAIYLARGVNINATAGRTYETPLFIAAANGHAGMVDLLILNGANISQQLQHGWTNYGKSALHIAAERGHIDVIRTIGKYRDDKSKNCCMYETCIGSHETPLNSAIKSGQVAAAKVLLELGGMRPFIDKFNFCPLSCAIENNQPEIANAIVDHMISTWRPVDVISYISSNQLLEHCFYCAARTNEDSYRALIRLCDYLVANNVSQHNIIELIKGTNYSSMRWFYIDFKKVLFDLGERLSPADCVVYDNELLDPDTYKGFLMTVKRGGKGTGMRREADKRRLDNTNIVLKQAGEFEKLAKEYDDAHPKVKEIAKPAEQPASKGKEEAEEVTAPQATTASAYPAVANVSPQYEPITQKYINDGRKQQEQAAAPEPVAVASVVQAQMQATQSAVELAFSSNDHMPINLPEPMLPTPITALELAFTSVNIPANLPPPMQTETSKLLAEMSRFFEPVREVEQQTTAAPQQITAKKTPVMLGSS